MLGPFKSMNFQPINQKHYGNPVTHHEYGLTSAIIPQKSF